MFLESHFYLSREKIKSEYKFLPVTSVTGPSGFWITVFCPFDPLTMSIPYPTWYIGSGITVDETGTKSKIQIIF